MLVEITKSEVMKTEKLKFYVRKITIEVWDQELENILEVDKVIKESLENKFANKIEKQ